MAKASKSNEALLTQEYLKSILHYDESTGVFTYKLPIKRGSVVGDKAGYINNGYVKIMINGIIYNAHRLAFLYMEGTFPEEVVDHIDRNRANNVWKNLRKASESSNQHNRGKGRNNNSGFKGVWFNKRRNKFRCRVGLYGRCIHIGYYNTIEEAIKARQEAADKLHGEFANNG